MLRVLLVEDHEDSRLMYAEFLREQFDVIQASDGRQAIEIMRRQIPDLLITDLSLPILDGFELMALVREDAALRHIPVICLSGYSDDEHEARARGAGCDLLLQKPCMPDVLARAASDLLVEHRERSVES